MCDPTYTLVCPACEESMEVNAAMRDGLIENGCVLCGSALSGNDFAPAS